MVVKFILGVWVLLTPQVLCLVGQDSAEQLPAAAPTSPSESTPAASDSAADRTLFWSGESIRDWTVTDFGTQRAVSAVEQGWQLAAGYPLTGVHSTARQWPVSDYEIEFEFRRIDGHDFPCCLTFPVDQSHVSLVIGGWGGTLCGLSCIAGQDASHNETQSHITLNDAQWYRTRVRVTADRIQAWLDDQVLVDQKTEGLELSVRNEVRLSRPLGICSFETTAQFRNFKIFSLRSGDRE